MQEPDGGIKTNSQDGDEPRYSEELLVSIRHLLTLDDRIEASEYGASWSHEPYETMMIARHNAWAAVENCRTGEQGPIRLDDFVFIDMERKILNAETRRAQTKLGPALQVVRVGAAVCLASVGLVAAEGFLPALSRFQEVGWVGVVVGAVTLTVGAIESAKLRKNIRRQSSKLLKIAWALNKREPFKMSFWKIYDVEGSFGQCCYMFIILMTPLSLRVAVPGDQVRAAVRYWLSSWDSLDSALAELATINDEFGPRYHERLASIHNRHRDRLSALLGERSISDEELLETALSLSHRTLEELNLLKSGVLNGRARDLRLRLDDGYDRNAASEFGSRLEAGIVKLTGSDYRDYDALDRYNRSRQYDLAIQDYTEAIRLNPQDGDAYYIRGFAYRNLGQQEQADRDFAKAKELGVE